MKTLKSSLKFSVVEITPKDAEVLLSKYLHNRPISRDNINKYAIQMSEGKWHLNGEAIIINDKGLTDNGYHRLAACIQAGVPFQTVLIEWIGVTDVFYFLILIFANIKESPRAHTYCCGISIVNSAIIIIFSIHSCK